MAKFYESLDDVSKAVHGIVRRLDTERNVRRLHMAIMLIHGAIVLAHGAAMLAAL